MSEPKCVGFLYQAILPLSEDTSRMSYNWISYDTNCSELVQTPQVKPQSHKTAPASDTSHKSQVVTGTSN